MEFEEFKQEVVDKIKDHLPEKYENATVTVSDVVKNNETLAGLTIRTDDVNVSPTIYLQSFYEEHEKGREMDEILDHIAAIYTEHAMDQDFDVSSITEFENVKDKIFPRVVGVEHNAELLENRPHTIVAEDIAIIYAVELNNNEQGSMSVPITNQLMDSYHINAEELHDIAMENLDKSMEITFLGMNEVMAEMMHSELMKEFGDEAVVDEMLANMMPPDDSMFVLSNAQKFNGAVAAFDQKTMDMIADRVGGDFYVLPSSTHECLVVPMTENCPERENLEAMVRDVNETEVAPQDKLSDSVYAYDSKEHELMRVDKYEERMAERANSKDEILADKPNEKPSFKEQLGEAKQEATIKNAEHKADPEKANNKNKTKGIGDN